MRTSDTYFPENKRLRVIIDSDAACECDDNYAILHAMMSKKADLRGVIATHFGAPAEQTMQASFTEITRLMELTKEDVSVYKGQIRLFEEAVSSQAENEGDCVPATRERCKESAEQPISDGVDFLIKESMAESERPLFVICQGALTNLATALQMQPQIASRLTAVLIAGTNYPVGGFEFNTMNDPAAFNFLMQSEMPLWVIPEEVYATLQVSFFEIMERVAPCAAVGEYLWASMQAANKRLSEKIQRFPFQSPEEFALGFPSGESWSLGDSAGIGVLLSANSGRWKEVPPPLVGERGAYTIADGARPVRWYEEIRTRFILEDFFAKLNFYYGDLK